MPVSGLGRVVGFIDLGSNSLRLLVVRVTPQGVVRVLNEAKHMVRLGEGALVNHALQPEAMARTMETLRAFASMCHGYGAEEYVAVATAAVRDASNGEAFLKEIREKTGIDMVIISGKEEARLIWRGVSSGMDKSDALRLYLDIGGGSTEMAAATSSEYQVLESLKIGCVRLSTLFNSGKRPVTPKMYQAMQMYVRNEGVHAFRRLADLNIPELVASSGTAQNLAEITAALGRGTSSPDTPQTMSYRGLCRTVRELCSRSRAERASVPGLNPKRLDVIIPGAAILQTVLEELNFDTVRISARGLRDGMVTEYVESNCPGARVPDVGIRDQSVLRLARACHFEEVHSRHVTKLALQLFDSAAGAGLHSYGEKEREWLRFASLLHDVGIFISFSKHNEHSHYLISNSDLLGFSKKEVRLIAAVTLLHRAKSVQKYLPRLEEGTAGLVQTLALFLALAEAMDKGHSAVVTKTGFSMQGRKVALTVECKAPAPLEKSRVLRCEERLDDLFKLPTMMIFHEPPQRHLTATPEDA